MAKQFVVSDGKLMLVLKPAEEGGYNVSSPIDPQLITQAETLEEAFANAYDARKALIEARTKLAKKDALASGESSHRKSKRTSQAGIANKAQDSMAESETVTSSSDQTAPAKKSRRRVTF